MRQTVGRTRGNTATRRKKTGRVPIVKHTDTASSAAAGQMRNAWFGRALLEASVLVSVVLGLLLAADAVAAAWVVA